MDVNPPVTMRTRAARTRSGTHLGRDRPINIDRTPQDVFCDSLRQWGLTMAGRLKHPSLFERKQGAIRSNHRRVIQQTQKTTVSAVRGRDGPARRVRRHFLILLKIPIPHVGGLFSCAQCLTAKSEFLGIPIALSNVSTDDEVGCLK